MEAAPSDEEITSAVWDILRENMDISRNEIKSKLESNFGWDLSERKSVLKSATASFIEELERDAAATQEEESAAPKKKAGGFAAPVQLSNELSDFLGEIVLPRTEVTKRIWAYIKEHDLQNPVDRREILCDAALETVLKGKKIKMFKMTKILSQQMKAVDSLQDTKPAAPVVKAEKKAEKRAPAAPSAAAGRGKKSSAAGSGGGGFGAPVQLSPELAGLLGDDVLPRTEVTKRIWDYIKSNELQNPQNRREILCDDSLQRLFNTKKIDMFKMTSKISEHLTSTGEPSAASLKRKADAENGVEPASKPKKQKKVAGEKKTGGFGGAVILSEPLANILNAQNGTTLPQWSRTEVVKVMWQYIREHNLQNPDDKREIILDKTLGDIFQTEKFTMFQMNKYLKDHLTPVDPTSEDA